MLVDNDNKHKMVIVSLFLLIFYLSSSSESRIKKLKRTTTKTTTVTQKICVRAERTMKAQLKMCFLRPDTGPCRADIIQWYFDVKDKRCYRFFWGGCQGNGNRFNTKEECHNACYVKRRDKYNRDTHFCRFPFDYGTCFGYFNRWTFDKDSGTCRSRVYSGCGGNQNNFQSKAECLIACLSVDNETLGLTTCVPINVNQIQ